MTWTVEQPKKETNCLDLTIEINNKNHIVHKPMKNNSTSTIIYPSTAHIHLVHPKV